MLGHIPIYVHNHAHPRNCGNVSNRDQYVLSIKARSVSLARTTSLTNGDPRPPVPPAHKADILRMLLLVISVAILAPLTDASKIYHSIRGQDTVKLYVIFNALEVRLFRFVSGLNERLTYRRVDCRPSAHIDWPRHLGLHV